MNRITSALAVLTTTLVTFSSPVYPSPPANNCAGPCDVCSADGQTCHRRWWQDLDTYYTTTYPVQINRTSTGKLIYAQCQFIPGTETLTSWCNGVKPQPITLREWCGRLMQLPVPPRLKPSDEGDLYVLLKSGGVCP